MQSQQEIHDKFAPFWAISLVIFATLGLSTNWLDLGAFWSGYVLDITGPAWNYILFRGLFTKYKEGAWFRFFTPTRTVLIFSAVCFGIETAQYFKLYDSTFDPFDLIAYISLLVPVFLVDLYQTRLIPD
jgi:hypothetical protein